MGSVLRIFLVLCASGAISLHAQNSRPVLVATTKPWHRLIEDPRIQELTNALLLELNSTATIAKGEVVAWSSKTDHLGVPPRLIEDIILLVDLVDTNGSNTWTLACLTRMTTGAMRGPAWLLPHYPPHCKAPVIGLSHFPVPPSDAQIAQFIRDSTFGYSAFDPFQTVLEVVVYRQAPEVEAAAKAGISDAEKNRRYIQDQDCFVERKSMPPQSDRK